MPRRAVNRYEAKSSGDHEHYSESRGRRGAWQDASSSLTRTSRISRKSRFTLGSCASTANEALMRLRKRRPNQFSLDERVEGDETSCPRACDWASPEPRFAQTEMHEIRSEVIDKLEPDFRLFRAARRRKSFRTEEAAKVTRHFGSSGKIPGCCGPGSNFVTNLNRYFRQVAQMNAKA